MSEDNVIYGLYHVDDGVIRYVGLSTIGNSRRLARHRYEANRGSHVPVHNWIRKHGPENIHSVVLQRFFSPEELPRAEIHWISALGTYAPENTEGLNLTRGGDGTFGYTHTPESRRKMSENHCRKSGPEHPMYGRPSPLRGSKKSPEFCRAASERVLGDKHPMFGKHHSEEARSRIRKANQGKTLSEEHKSKISESHKGLRPSPEQLAASKVRKNVCPSCGSGPYSGKGLGQHFRYNPTHRSDGK